MNKSEWNRSLFKMGCVCNDICPSVRSFYEVIKSDLKEAASSFVERHDVILLLYILLF